MASKNKLNRSEENKSGFSLDSENSIVVLSAHPSTLQEIRLISKRFLKLSGFNEDLLINNKASIFLP
jgi:hypothetical protein